jgi:hypothetical protein
MIYVETDTDGKRTDAMLLGTKRIGLALVTTLYSLPANIVTCTVSIDHCTLFGLITTCAELSPAASV